MITNQSAGLSFLLETNNNFVNEYKNNPLIRFLNTKAMQEKAMRERLLDCIQVFSDYFQKVVMLRYALCDSPKFLLVAQQHLQEEFGHNHALQQDRQNRLTIWDPVLEATSSWFAWKMLTLDAEEKTVLIHLVLESSAHIFFKQAHQIMNKYQETQYFKIHNEADEAHEQMGVALLQGLTAEKYQRLQEVQAQGWKILNVACKQISALAQEGSSIKEKSAGLG